MDQESFFTFGTIMGLVIAAVGLVLVLLGQGRLREQLRRSRSWRRDRATVVGYDWRGMGDQSVQHWVMERTDPRGEVHRTQSEFGMSHGTMRRFPFDVDVLVDPEDESSYVLAGGCRSGWGGLAFVLGGAVLATLGLLILIFS